MDFVCKFLVFVSGPYFSGNHTATLSLSLSLPFSFYLTREWIKQKEKMEGGNPVLRKFKLYGCFLCDFTYLMVSAFIYCRCKRTVINVLRNGQSSTRAEISIVTFHFKWHLPYDEHFGGKYQNFCSNLNIQNIFLKSSKIKFAR